VFDGCEQAVCLRGELLEFAPPAPGLWLVASVRSPFRLRGESGLSIAFERSRRGPARRQSGSGGSVEFDHGFEDQRSG